MVDYRDLGKRVRRLRRERKMTQESLAEKVGISASFMGHVERGTRVASLETLVALCNVLKVSPQELLAASLEDEFTAHMPASLTSKERNQLCSLLRIAQDALYSWGDDEDEDE